MKARQDVRLSAAIQYCNHIRDGLYSLVHRSRQLKQTLLLHEQWVLCVT